MNSNHRVYLKRAFDHFKSIPFDMLADSVYSKSYITDGCYDDSWLSDSAYEVADACDCSSMENGMTKMVFFFDDMDSFVVKIPFLGTDIYKYTEDGFEDWVDRIEFEGIQSLQSNKKNYCEREARLYKKACQIGLEKFFASTEYAFELYNMVPFYISEKCTLVDDDSMEDIDAAGEKKANRAVLGRFGVPAGISDRLYETSSHDEISSLVDFLKSNKISDLHGDNWGADLNGNLKIIDYSSFFENFENLS